MTVRNDYIPLASKILEIIKHTNIEYTFRMAFEGDVKPGQFFEVSVPRYGEAPISVSGIGNGFVDLTIRRVGKVTNEVFERYVGDTLMMRGPFGNGFDVDQFKAKPILIIAGGTGVAPVRGVISYFADPPDERKNMTVLASFKREQEILFRKELEDWKRNMDVFITLTKEEVSGYMVGRAQNHIASLMLGNLNETVAIIVGPSELMKASAKILLELGMPEQNIWISEERKMCCGLGKCGHCRVNSTYICLDGSVFNYSVGKFLFD